MLADKLALLNAILNAASGICLVIGWLFIRARQPEKHRIAMLSAFGISAVFLVSYLTRVALSGTHPYPPEAPGRAFYLAMLASHVVLAASVPFFAVGAIWAATRQRFDLHKRLVRWGLPIWLYVSVTGVGVYLMLYQLAGVT
jgi:putative membrane protein